MLSERTGWTQPGSGSSISLPWLSMEPLNLEHPTAQVTLPGIFMELTIAQNKDVLSQPLLLLGRPVMKFWPMRLSGCLLWQPLGNFLKRQLVTILDQLLFLLH